MNYDRFLTPMGIEPHGLEEVLTFHETVKRKPTYCVHEGIQVSAYVASLRGILEAVHNYKSYHNRPGEPLIDTPPEDTPMEKVIASRTTAETFCAEQRLDPSLIRRALHSLKETRRGVSRLDMKTPMAFRSYPSAGGLYSIETYLLENNYDGRWSLYHTSVRERKLRLIRKVVDPEQLSYAVAANDPQLLVSAGGLIIHTFFPERTVAKYGANGYRFAMIEAGIVSHQLSLLLTEAGVGTKHWGGYFDDLLTELMCIDSRTELIAHLMWYGSTTIARATEDSADHEG